MKNSLDRISLRKIIQSLMDGIPSSDHILHYTSDNYISKSPVSDVVAQLGDVQEGLSIAKFLRGEYGEGKSHTLSVIKELALQKNFVVSQFALEYRGTSFDFIERVLSKLIEVMSVKQKRYGDAEATVLDHVIGTWAKNVNDLDNSDQLSAIAGRDFDLDNALGLYGKIITGREPRYQEGRDRIELLNYWFRRGETGLNAAERRLIHVRNNITPRNARTILNQLAVFFHKIGFSGWVILIDEQEIIPTLMSPRKRNLCNQNLRIVIDASPDTKYLYYLFATSPEFFTDRDRGINSYPALKDRVKDYFSVSRINAQEMVEVGGKILDIYPQAYPEIGRPSLLSKAEAHRAIEYLDDKYANHPAKARGFVQSFTRLLEKRRMGSTIEVVEEYATILANVFAEIDEEKSLARRKYLKV